jgi:O-antigen/teichoic acid export membrane protein
MQGKIIINFQNILASVKTNRILYRLAHGAFWSLLGTAASKVFSVITTIVIARMLGVSDFGAYGMVQSTIEMFCLVAGLSLSNTSNKYLSEYKTKNKEKAGRIISLTNGIAVISSGIIGLVIYLSSSYIAGETLGRIDLSPLLKLGAIYLFISTQNNVQTGSLGGFEAFKETAKINALQGLLTPLVALPLVFFFGLQGAVISLIITSLIGYVLFRNELNRTCKKYNICIQRFDKSAFKEISIIWHFSIPSLASGLLVIPVIWLTNAILVNQPGGYLEMGLFNAANQWRQFVIFIPNILSTVMLPIFSDVYGNRSDGEYRSVFQLNIQLTWMIALPATILIIAVREVLAIVFGSKYQGVDVLIVPLMITAFLHIMNNVVGSAIAGAGRMWLGATFNLFWAIAMVLCSMLLIPKFGGMGLALSYMIAYLLHTGWQAIYTERKLIPNSLKKFTSLFLLTLCTLIPVYVLIVLNELNIYLSVAFVLASSIPLIQVTIKYCQRVLNNQISRG